jgi:hypothetical protein
MVVKGLSDDGLTVDRDQDMQRPTSISPGSLHGVPNTRQQGLAWGKVQGLENNLHARSVR